MMSRHARRLVMLAAALSAGCCYLQSQRLAAQSATSGPASDISVSVATAERHCFSDTLQVTGVVVPRNEIFVRPNREGLQISEVLVEPGDSVISGQVLARLIPVDSQPSRGSGIALQAPQAGIIVSKNVAIGALASARGMPLFRIAGGGEMELLAETPAKTLDRLLADQQAKVEILGIGELNGKVRLVPAAINATTQLAQLRISLGNDSRLRVGLFGLGKIQVGGSRCGPAIPLAAVLYGSDGAVVQVVRNNVIETRRVKVGMIAQGQAEIRQGINIGDLVVARAGSFVRDGDRVRVMKANEPVSQ
jgi:multidrug efflux pump subunit AcrA (membrane-fusion protein)